MTGSVSSEKTSVSIYNMNGEKIVSLTLTDEMKHEFSLSGRPAGIYLISVNGVKYSGTTRIIKQ